MNIIHKLAWIIVLSLSHIICCDAEEATPPRKEEIARHVNELWHQEKFDELQSYVNKLEKQYKNYIPTYLIKESYFARYGSQYELAIGLMEKLQWRVTMYPQYMPPAFEDSVAGSIQRLKSLGWENSPYTNLTLRLEKYWPSHMTRQQRAKNFFVLPDYWMFQVAPEISFPEKEGDRPIIHFPPTQGGRTSLTNAALLEQLRDKRFNSEGDPDIRSRLGEAKRDVIRQIAQRKIKEAIPDLVNRLSDVWPVDQAAAEALGDLGEEAIPPLLEFLQDKENSRGSDEQKLAIWALLRIGVADKRVLSTLQKMAAEKPSLVADYAQRAVDCLRQK